jgi:hypothetical protein
MMHGPRFPFKQQAIRQSVECSSYRLHQPVATADHHFPVVRAADRRFCGVVAWVRRTAAFVAWLHGLLVDAGNRRGGDKMRRIAALVAC